MGAARAQEARGTVLGRITDPTGAVVPSAEIRAVSAATGVAVVAKSNESGNYAVPYLVAGFYNITAESTGFKKFVRDGVQVRVGDRVELNIEMAIGDVAEQLEVKATTPLLATADASLGQVVDERRVLELPLFDGNAMSFTLMAPGAVNTTDMRLGKAAFNNKPSQFSTDGGGTYNNEFTIDGIPNTFSDSTQVRVAFSPPQAAIGEFKVQTSQFDAGVGHTQGALVNISTKGGTNQLHGSVWEWIRNSIFDTKTLFQNRAGVNKPHYTDNRYGISAGGPIYIPGLYNGKNKSFWQFTFEGNKFGDPAVGAITATVPRAPWKTGDLSDLLKLGASYQVYDPGTIAVAPNGRFSRQPFPGNIVPQSRIDPISTKILAMYALPNQAGGADGANNFFNAGRTVENYWTTIGRVDHAFSEKDRLFVRFQRDFWLEDKNRTFGNVAALKDINGIYLNRINRGIALDEVHMISSSLVLQFRYGVTAQEFPERRVSQGFELTSLGFSPSLAALFPKDKTAIPNISVGSLTALSGSESGDGTATSMSHTAVANFTWMHGNHNVRFGPDFRVYRVFSDRHSGDDAPIFSFNSVWGAGPLDNSPAPPVGGQLVALLLGIPNGNATHSGSFAQQDKYLGLYIQDDYKISRKLTLNLGLRVEHDSPLTERFNRSATTFAGNVANPLAAQAIANYAQSPIPEIAPSAFKVNGGLLFAGVNGAPRELWNSVAVQWMPRIGLAYQMNEKTVIRAGYGIFFGAIGAFNSTDNLAGFSQSTPMQPTSDNGLTFTNKLANPLPTGLLNPLGSGGGLATNVGQAISYFAADRKPSYANRWSFGVQRQLPGNFMVEASYVGNRSTHLPVSRNINYIPASYLSRAPFRDTATINYLGQAFPSPFYGLNPQFTSQTMARSSLLLPYPEFGNITYLDPVGYSWYHSLQSQAEKRFSRGFTFQMAYTWSRAMEATTFLNAQDPMPYESLSSIDRAHRVTGSGIFELPFGHGRHFGSQMPKALDFIVGGWQLSTAFQRQSGQPIDWGQMIITGNGNLALPSDQRSADHWFNTAIFDNKSADQLASNIRTFPLRFSNVRFDSQRRVDFSLNKMFQFSEKFKMRFRADTFNSMNTPVLRGPNTTVTSSAFGTITDQESPRTFQFSLNIQF
jgi:hypothetical protein